MENTHPGHAHEDGVINEIGDGIQGLISPHTAHVEVLVEIQFTVVYRLPRLPAHGLHKGLGLLLFGLVGTLQAVGPHFGLHVTKDDGGHLPFQALDGAHRGKALDAHRVARSQRRLGHRTLDGLGLQGRSGLLFGLLLLALLPALLALLYLLYLLGYQFVVGLSVCLQHLVLKGLQLLTHPLGLLLLGLALTNLADGILYLAVALLE